MASFAVGQTCIKENTARTPEIRRQLLWSAFKAEAKGSLQVCRHVFHAKRHGKNAEHSRLGVERLHAYVSGSLASGLMWQKIGAEPQKAL